MSGKSSTTWLVAALLSGMVLFTLWVALPVGANPPVDGPKAGGAIFYRPDGTPYRAPPKDIDQPNPQDYQRIRARQRLLDAGQTAEAASLAITGTDRVLVLLVEFAGTDVFTWTPGVSTWDPLGRSNPGESVLDENGNLITGDCSAIISQTTVFTYTGPLHNEVPRPVSAADRSGDSIWAPDFSQQWFYDFMFGDGVTFNYTRTDESQVYEDFHGKSVKQYYQDMSSGQYNITGDVYGWLRLPHSTWYYGADLCPGARTIGSSSLADVAIPMTAGGPRAAVRDALDALNAISNTIPGFDWRNYDLNGDGIIDRLWIVHAGYGEEDATTLLDRTSYGEGAIWSHSSGVTPPYPVGQGVSAGRYIIMPENGGIGVFAHEYAHNLGAEDLYAYGSGEPSAGFWALQADDWTGYPIGFQPPAVDPLHLDEWGWLDPAVITDTTKTYEITLGQASAFPGGAGAYRGAKIPLPDGVMPFAVQPTGNYQWWGGKDNLLNAMMISKDPIPVPAGGATLVFSSAYGIETEWDFLWVAAGTSPTDMSTWHVLTNTHTVCTHAPEWIGGAYGFPDDLCAAGMGGFTDYNASFPDYGTETFDLTPFAGQNLYLAFWYMTDWGGTYEGPFIDNIVVRGPGGAALFSDDAESGDAKWTYGDGWNRNDGTQSFKHNYYLQWRNVSATGGYDSALGDPRWRFGPANTGLLVWYNNQHYTDNEVFNYLTDWPSFGPKGRMLVVDAHPEPYRDPYLLGIGYNNEAGNVTSRSQMRDAPFSLWPSVSFGMNGPYVMSPTVQFSGRPAVSQFSDAVGFYPGAELVSRGPGYPPATAYGWVTKQWDASAVVPSKSFYRLDASGYKGDGRFRFGGTPILSGPYAGMMSAWAFANGLGYDGGTGNPRSVKGQYGWHVQIISQTNMTATVRIWNAPYSVWLPVIVKGD